MLLHKPSPKPNPKVKPQLQKPKPHLPRTEFRSKYLGILEWAQPSNMAPSRKWAKGKEAPGQRPPSKSARLGRSSDDLDCSPPLEDHANCSPRVSSTAVEDGSRQVLGVLQQATQELSQEELAALQDPGFRSQASRWRTGTSSRRLSAALARLLNAMEAIKPAWLKPVDAQQDLPLVETLSFKKKDSGRAQEVHWFGRCSRTLTTLSSNYWRALVAVCVMLFFPRLTAALLAMMVRMIIRLVMALFMRALKEIWQEMNGVLFQLSSLTTGLEHALVQNLENMMNEWAPPSLAAPSLDMNQGEQNSQNHGGAQPPPNPPSQLLTQMMLLLNFGLQFRLLRHGGVGN